MWHDGSNANKGLAVIRTYYKLKGGGENLPFGKRIYSLRNPETEGKDFMLIHYVGESSHFQPKPHGNSKSGRIYVRNSKTVRESIADKVKATGKGPEAIFHDLDKEFAKNEDLYRTHKSVLAPRDPKQCTNVKYSVNLDRKILRCDTFSVIEMGKNPALGKFILKHVVVPYEAIVLADPKAIEFGNAVLKAAVNDTTLPQVLSLDTTFELADAYCTIAVLRNTFIQGDPIFPVAFLLHDRKCFEVQRDFWMALADVLFIKAFGKNVPVVTDRERALSTFLNALVPGVNLIFCSNHIVINVEQWVKDHGGKSDDIIVLKDCIKKLINCETEQEFDFLYEKYAADWSQEFKLYVERYLKFKQGQQNFLPISFLHFVTMFGLIFFRRVRILWKRIRLIGKY